MNTDTEIRNEKLSAELNEEYYRARAASAMRIERAVQVSAAVTSLAAVSTWIASAAGFAQSAWAVLSILVAVLSAASPIMRWADDAVHFNNLASKWTHVAGQLRLLERTAGTPDEQHARLLEIMAESEGLQREDTTLPDDRLIRKLRQKVEIRHGLRAVPA